MSTTWKWAAVGLGVAAVGAMVGWCLGHPRLTALRAGGAGPPTMVLLHGYGSSAEQWLPFTHSIPFPPQGRFLLPEAPETFVRLSGASQGRAWWDLDLAAHRRPGQLGVDLVGLDPRGLERAAKLVRDLLASEGNSAHRPFVLGGFSQGAMVSCQVAFASDEPLAALVILSGTPINQAAWRPLLARRKGLPVFMSHGRSDAILPYDLAETLRADLVAAGLAVTFVPFDGGHEIPAEVVVALGNFLAQVKP